MGIPKWNGHSKPGYGKKTTSGYQWKHQAKIKANILNQSPAAEKEE